MVGHQEEMKQSVAIYQHPAGTFVCIVFQFKFRVSQVFTAISPGV